MFVQVKALQYWKTDHKDMDGCQDACSVDATRGLFAIADGAGTTLFPAIWARILAGHFVAIPLMSDNVFEVEWWVRLAQEQYKTRIPALEQLRDWSVQQKAQNQGSDSTLATVRVSSIDPASSSAQTELLVFGDSCVIIGNTQSGRIDKSFVLQHPSEFGQAPICVPSTLKFFNRDFHRCSITPFRLELHHRVILATDAVAKWILSGGSHSDTWDAFQEVCALSTDDWPDFIDRCRQSGQMVDDDATALVLQLREDAGNDSVPLNATTAHDPDVVQGRKEAFEKARQDKNSELIAVYYGDGKDLESLVNVTDEEIGHARKVAHALKEVMRVFRQAQNSANLAAQVEPLWRQYGHRLQNERCADNLRATLQRNGINLTLPGQATAPSPAGNVIPPMIGLPSSLPGVHPGQSYVTAQGKASIGPSQELQDALRRKDLELDFLRAFNDKRDDERFLAAAEALEAARATYPDLPPFTSEEAARLEEVRKLKYELEKLRAALQDGQVKMIAEAYNPLLISSASLTPDERERVEMARRLVDAYRADDDDEIVKAHDAITFSRHQRAFTFTQEDGNRVLAARQRKEALAKFRVALDSRSLQQIVEHYDPILNTCKQVDTRDRELLHLAQEFIVARTANDDDAIVAAYEKIKRPPYNQLIQLTSEEQSRITQAEMHTRTMLLTSDYRVATITVKEGKEDISLDLVRDVCRVKVPHVNNTISKLQQAYQNTSDARSKQGIDLRIIELKSGIEDQRLPYFALEDIIIDALIRKQIDEEKGRGVAQHDFDETGKFPLFFEDFKQYAVPDYYVWLRSNNLTDDEVGRILLIFLRRELFSVHFERQQKAKWLKNLVMQPLQLNEWVAMQKEKQVTYTMHGSDPDKRASWLRSLLEQGR